ncbi:methyltransferase [Roseivirga ehrenbergii]|uniref:Methyltransferase n=1 Tax=Roseivirga ehrenbergii (strain DSM 102268 / JCM 13514 / KCTC 12282 / NCIMB 14502 / KMM 6017) TaxID=279360 RepID=A0A150XQU3_ROSEK|nr:methyltransferase [Roseivirga ehrenbergii]
MKKCRVCGNKNLVDVVNLGSLALAGVFPESKSVFVPQAPLVLTKCHGDESCCHLLQLVHTYDLDQMYGENYGYRSGLNEHMIKHLKGKVQYILDMLDLSEDDLVLDIGSNDGSTLGFYPKHIKTLVGIDPTAKKFASFYSDNVKLLMDFFSKAMYEKSFGGRKAKVITSFSMFYDLPDPVHFAQEVSEILDKQGIWVLEQSYMPTMLDKASYDTICHEHLEYYGLRQIKWIMDKANLNIVDVSFNEINGGSFSVTVAHKEYSGKKFTSKVSDVLKSESVYSELKPFRTFAEQIETVKYELLEKLKQLKNEGKKVAAIGASTKGNVILQYCGLDTSLLEVVGEVNDDKFGKFTPGTYIPIQSEDTVLASSPDFLLVLPWHLHSFFDSSEKFKEYNLIYPINTFDS